MFTRKPLLQPEKFAVDGAKRLLQHNPPGSSQIADVSVGPGRARSCREHLQQKPLQKPDFAVGTRVTSRPPHRSHQYPSLARAEERITRSASANWFGC
jgi:hypothetical protein